MFYQIAPQPLVTATGSHFIGEAIRLCGGVNVFESVPGLTPVVSQEAVIAAAPQVIIAADYEPGPASLRPMPRRCRCGDPGRTLPASALGGLFVLDPDLLNVPGPRMLRGIAAALCPASMRFAGKQGAGPSSLAPQP